MAKKKKNVVKTQLKIQNFYEAKKNKLIVSLKKSKPNLTNENVISGKKPHKKEVVPDGRITESNV